MHGSLALHTQLFCMLICFILWTAESRIGDRKPKRTISRQEWSFLSLRQALLLTSLKKTFQFPFPLIFHSGIKHRSREPAAMNLKVCCEKKSASEQYQTIINKNKQYWCSVRKTNLTQKCTRHLFSNNSFGQDWSILHLVPDLNFLSPEEEKQASRSLPQHQASFLHYTQPLGNQWLIEDL